jgi:hypothetical protein
LGHEAEPEGSGGPGDGDGEHAAPIPALPGADTSSEASA